jgi:AraC-like DNA-binding protein
MTTSIPTVDTSFACLFVLYLDRTGYPVREWLSEEYLPISLVRQMDGFVSEYHLRKFLVLAAERTGIDDLGLRVAGTVSMDELGSLSMKMKAMRSLYASLALFCKEIAEVNSHATFWLSRSDGKTWFFRHNPHELDVAQDIAEQFTVRYMVKLVQLTAGPEWHPEQVWLKSPGLRGYKKYPEFKNSKISLARGVTAVMLPEDDESTDIPKRMTPPLPQPPTLTDSLKTLLKMYLPDNCPGIDVAAELSRLSVRTFKRKLENEKTTYRKLLQQTRFEMACSMLENTDMNMLDIANSIAYSHPGNFTRAFQKWSGLSPQEYREKHRRV